MEDKSSYTIENYVEKEKKMLKSMGLPTSADSIRLGTERHPWSETMRILWMSWREINDKRLGLYFLFNPIPKPLLRELNIVMEKELDKDLGQGAQSLDSQTATEGKKRSEKQSNKGESAPELNQSIADADFIMASYDEMSEEQKKQSEKRAQYMIIDKFLAEKDYKRHVKARESRGEAYDAAAQSGVIEITDDMLSEELIAVFRSQGMTELADRIEAKMRQKSK